MASFCGNVTLLILSTVGYEYGILKPGFHSNAIACVGKQPIMVASATASTEHSYWLALAFVA